MHTIEQVLNDEDERRTSHIKQVLGDETERRKALLELSTDLYAGLPKVASDEAVRRYIQENQERIDTVLMLVIYELADLTTKALQMLLEEPGVKVNTSLQALQAVARSPKLTDIVVGLDRADSLNAITNILNLMGPQTDYTNLLLDAARVNGDLQKAVAGLLRHGAPSVPQFHANSQ